VLLLLGIPVCQSRIKTCRDPVLTGHNLFELQE
jgi:hypothetical protein